MDVNVFKNNIEANADKFLSNYAFVVKCNPNDHVSGVRKRSINITQNDSLDKKTFDIEIAGTGQDAYYFPYLTAGVGYTIVPKDVPNGTIVMSDGMTGCALQVNLIGNQLLFMHDKDSTALRDNYLNCRTNLANSLHINEKDLVNNHLLRVERRDYRGKNDYTYNSKFMLAENSHGREIILFHTPFFVKTDNKWELYMSLFGYHYDINKRGDKIESFHGGIAHAVSNLTASFLLD